MNPESQRSREASPSAGSRGSIKMRGVAVHNLKGLNLDIPLGQLIAVCGVSGSGKTSLALDTLYAEGRRRYIESFSAYTRQFLEKLEKPDVESITGLPPAIAVTHESTPKNSRGTVGNVTEIDSFLQLLFAKISQAFCNKCQLPARSFSAAAAATVISKLPAGQRLMITTACDACTSVEQTEEYLQTCREQGYLRILFQAKTWQLDDAVQATELAKLLHVNRDGDSKAELILDRLTTSETSLSRVRESVEAAYRFGSQQATAVYVQQSAESTIELIDGLPIETAMIDGASWGRIPFSHYPLCAKCGQIFAVPSAKLFNPNSPLGACPDCNGFGNKLELDMNLIVPDRSKSLKQGAIAPWNTPAYEHELKELLDLAEEYEIPTKVPFAELSQKHLALIQHGVPAKKFGGLDGFFRWLEKRKYKMHIRVFLSRWRSSVPCPTCQGSRLNESSLSYRVANKTIAEVEHFSVGEMLQFFESLSTSVSQTENSVAAPIMTQIMSRLRYLQMVGLEYLALDRMVRTLSGGESQRLTLTAALGSSLVNVLYVLDEPSAGLHPSEISRMIAVLQSLRDRGNTVVAVEHDATMLRHADQLIEIGPGAGEQGGKLVFQGTPTELIKNTNTMTAEYLSGRRGGTKPKERRATQHGWLRLSDARGNNLKNITVEIPLGTLAVICGVSASGKSTLVEQTLYPALCKRKKIDAPAPLPFKDILGDGQIEDVILVDQSPIGRSPRSNPVTYLKIFDDIRKLFAETLDAKIRNYGAGHFSFNVAGGRCETCEGEGFLRIDMQFLADVFMKCPQCHGRRFRPEILTIQYRSRNIADVLDMTVREAFTFFRGATHIQAKLKQLIDVGLEYLRLGQPANTLSAGEAQRLKLAGYISSLKRSRTLFLLDEPTTGLHFADVEQLLDCFQALLNVGHSLIVVEHHPMILQAADYLIELGPGPADAGGEIVAKGMPEELMRKKESPTGRFLAELNASKKEKKK